MTNIDNIPKLRFPGFSGEWPVRMIGEFSKTFSGGTPTSSTKSYYSGEIPFIKSGEISASKTEQFISEQALKESSAKLVEKGDILYALYGATSGQVSISKIEGAINQAILCIRPEANKYFIYSKLTGSKEKILKTYLQGGQGNLSADIIKKLPVGLPIEDEQDKIAEFLTVVDERVVAIDKKVGLLKQYKKGVMQKIFTQQIRFKDENGKNYPSWQTKTLGEIVRISAGYSKSEYINVGGTNVIIDMGAVSSDGRLIETKRTNNNEDLLSKSDLIMAKDDIGGGNIIGKVVTIPKENKYILGDHVYRLNVQQGSVTYLYFAINSPRINRSFRTKANGTAQLGIINKTVADQAIPFPDAKEQEKIADFLTAIDDKIKAEESKLEQAKLFKKSLLQRMFV